MPMKGKICLPNICIIKLFLTLILKQGLTSPVQNYSMAQKEDLINCVHSFLSQKNSQMLYHMIGITQINEH